MQFEQKIRKEDLIVNTKFTDNSNALNLFRETQQESEGECFHLEVDKDTGEEVRFL